MPEYSNHTRTIFQFSYETDIALLHTEETEVRWLPHRLAWKSERVAPSLWEDF